MRKKSEMTMQSITDCVNQFYLNNRRSPAISEIATELGLAKSLIYRYLLEMDDKGLLSYDGKTGVQTETTSKCNLETTSVAILGSIACGLPQYAEENIEEYVTLPVSIVGPGKFFILHAYGESMIEAGIMEGDLVIVRKQETANDGDIVVALIDNETTLKRFYRDPEKRMIRLHPENNSMKDLFVRNCVIQGVAIKVIKNLV